MDERVATSVARPRFSVMLFSGFAAAALLLSAVGVYGVMAYSVVQRNHEIGVRVALGTRRGDIIWLLGSQALTPVLFGTAAGFAIALTISRAMESLLYGIRATDLATYTAIILIVIAAAATAIYFPARRASRTDPMAVLRDE